MDEVELETQIDFNGVSHTFCSGHFLDRSKNGVFLGCLRVLADSLVGEFLSLRRHLQTRQLQPRLQVDH